MPIEEDRSTAAPTGEFGGENYLEWKGWDASQFGRMEAGEASRFRAMTSGVLPAGGGADILEIGFGSGSFMGFCRQSGYRVIGAELNPVLVEAAAGAGFTAVPHHALADMPDGSFDLIAAFDVIEHIGIEDMPDFLSDLRRLVRPDGHILLRFPNGDSWHSMVNYNGDPTHVSWIGYFKLKFVAQQAGLSIAAFRGEPRKGFETSMTHGVHKLITAPFRGLYERLHKALYFPGSPIVVGSSNVLAILSPAGEGHRR